MAIQLCNASDALNGGQVQRQMEVITLWPGPLFDFPAGAKSGGFRRASQMRRGVSRAENNMEDWEKTVG